MAAKKPSKAKASKRAVRGKASKKVSPRFATARGGFTGRISPGGVRITE